jgi:hypothetical protein
MAGGIGDIAQRPLPGEHCQPVHRGPDGVLDAIAALTVEHARVDQLVERGAEIIQRHAVRPGRAARGAVGVLLRYRERGGEQPWLLPSEVEVGPADRAESAASRGCIAVLPVYAGDAGGHARGEFAHGGRADRGEELVTVGEVPVGGIRHHANHPCRFTEDDRIRAANPGKFQPCGYQTVADGPTRPPPSLGYLTC